MYKEIVKHRWSGELVLACETMRCVVHGYRDKLSLCRIDIRRERDERILQVLDRFLVSCPSRVYSKGEY